VAVTGEPDRSAEDVLPALQVALRGLALGLGGLFRDPDPVLLGLRELERDRVRIEGLQELAGGWPDRRRTSGGPGDSSYATSFFPPITSW